MRKGFFLAICIFACSTASPSIASTITYDVSFDVDAVVHTVVGDVSASGTVDVKLTSDGPATQASDVITVPFTVTDVAVTSNNALLNALIPFVQDLLPSGLGTTFTYNVSANKVSLTDQFTFITATQVNIISPFVTTGNNLSFDHADFSTPAGPGTVDLNGDIRFSATGGPIDINVAAVPGPIVGAGLPGIVMAFAGLIAWRRCRNQAAVA